MFDPAVNGMFTGELSDLTLRQALEAVLVPAGLDIGGAAASSTSFPAAPRRGCSRSASSTPRAAGAGATGASDAGGSGELTATVDADFFGELTAGIQALLSPAGRVHLDRTAGVVQVTDFADRLQQVGIYIETVTLRATRQVQIVGACARGRR